MLIYLQGTNLLLFLYNLLTDKLSKLIKIIKLMDPRPYHYQYRRPRFQNPTYQSSRLYESIYHLGAYGKMYPKQEKINNYPISSSQANLGYRINPEYERNAQKMPVQPRNGSLTDRSNGDGREANRIVNRNQPYTQNYMNNRNEREQKGHTTNMNNYQSIKFQNQIRDRKINDYAREKDSNIRNVNQDPRQYYDLKQPRQNRQQNYNPERAQSNQPRSYSQDTPSLNSRQSQQKQGYMSNYGNRLMRAMPGKDQDYVYERQQKPYNIISCYPREVYNAHRVYPKFTLESKLIETGHYPRPNNSERY